MLAHGPFAKPALVLRGQVGLMPTVFSELSQNDFLRLVEADTGMRSTAGSVAPSVATSSRATTLKMASISRSNSSTSAITSR